MDRLDPGAQIHRHTGIGREAAMAAIRESLAARIGQDGQVHVCGPEGFMQAIRAMSDAILGPGRCTSEAFAADTDVRSDAFEVVLARSGRRIADAEGETESLDGKPLAPVTPEFGAFDGGQAGCVFDPMATLLVNNDHAVMFAFLTRSATRTDVQTIWLVRDGAVEGQDYDPATLMHVWDTTPREDKTITENNPLGVLSRAYQPGVFSAQASRIADFGRWYMRQLTA